MEGKEAAAGMWNENNHFTEGLALEKGSQVAQRKKEKATCVSLSRRPHTGSGVFTFHSCLDLVTQ